MLCANVKFSSFEFLILTFASVLVEISTALMFWSLREPPVQSVGQADQTTHKTTLCLLTVEFTLSKKAREKKEKLKI